MCFAFEERIRLRTFSVLRIVRVVVISTYVATVLTNGQTGLRGSLLGHCDVDTQGSCCCVG